MDRRLTREVVGPAWRNNPFDLSQSSERPLKRKKTDDSEREIERTKLFDRDASQERTVRDVPQDLSREVDEDEGSPYPEEVKAKDEVVQDSEASGESEEITPESEIRPSQTNIEQAAPPIKTDKEAIREYERVRAAEGAISSELRDRLGQKNWVKGKSSIYVDAFNLALQVVLEEESHLFNQKELRIFDEWKGLSYEAQFLYVRLFLRKTAAWHRTSRLRYYDDIGDIASASNTLFTTRKLPLVAEAEGSAANTGPIASIEAEALGDTFTFADHSDEHIRSLDEASSLLLLDELKVLAKEAKVQGKNKSELLRNLRRTSGKQRGLGFASLGRTESEDSVQSEASESREESPTKDDVANRDEFFTKKILAETGPCIRLTSAPFRLFERVHLVYYRSSEWTEKSLTTIILARISRRNFPQYIVSRSASIFPSRSLLLEYETSLRAQFRVDNIIEFGKGDLQEVIDLCNDVYPRWKELLLEEQHKENSIYMDGEGAYLRRLSPAWVYTRLIHKASFLLGTARFKDHKREHGILTELLTQRLFHHSRRGQWYQRKALLEEHYMAQIFEADGRSPDEQKKHWKHIAVWTCEEGLQDNLVHVIYHYDLQKRLTKLEKQLRIPKREQHDFGHARLVKPLERTFEGIRIEKETNATPTLRRASTDAVPPPPTTDGSVRRGGPKTIWLDPAVEGHAECSVEEMCLSNYRAAGWKGYHSEGGIVRTLFALLFYDVLFAYVPNVFQTPYQTCPLDLHTDAFYPTRMSEVNARLAEIANGEAERLICQVWSAHAEARTCVVGLDWDFALEDLCEIARCFNGEALATLCKVVAQEYAERGGGVPDLFLWDERRPVDDRVCFAEVKSENDRLSDTQRMWIHVLTGAGIRVELCHATAKEIRAVG